LAGKFSSTLCNLLQRKLDPQLRARLEALPVKLNEFGVDTWGLDPEVIKATLPIAVFFYRRYFRVETVGIKNVPAGRALLIANHSGQIPIDGALIALSLLLEADPPRVVRSMVEKWVPTLPFVSWFFARCGQIVGTPENCRQLLENEELILVFPEGTRGISKPFSRRYQLQEFGQGFMRLALAARAPIVPVAVVGAEEQIINLADVKPLARLLGMPSLPLPVLAPLLGPLSMWPLPVKIRIFFGKPLYFSGHPDEEDEILEKKVQQVRHTIQRMLSDGLKVRRGVFF